MTDPLKRKSHAAVASQAVEVDDRSVLTEAFLNAFRHHPAGVAIITGDVEGTPAALTVSSLISVGISPPMVAFSLSDNSSSARILRRAGSFAIHFIRRANMHLARLCATSGADRFGDDVRWERMQTGEPFYPQVELIFRAVLQAQLAVPGACIVSAELVGMLSSGKEMRERDALVYADRTWHGLTPVADAVRAPLFLWPDDSATF